VSTRVSVILGVVAALAAPAAAQQRRNDRQDKAQQQELQALVQHVDAAMAGQPLPADIGVTWHNDFLKALEGKTYVPFILDVDPAPIGTSPLALYLRVVKRGATLPTETKGQKGDAKPEPYPFEDLHFIQPKPPEPGRPHRISRAFAAAAGDYDVYIALRERPNAANTAQGASPKTTVLRQALTIPDFWGGGLTTSSILVARSIRLLDAPLAADQQKENPYTIGATEIGRELGSSHTKLGDLNLILQIYNAALGPDKRPDLTVEYEFHQKVDGGEKYFNRTEPQLFNSSTLPPQFDVEKGHQINANVSIPLATFPAGDFRLEIKIADNIAQAKLVRTLMFSVVEP
jgi:type II secretory pathway pseudopilin PulG